MIMIEPIKLNSNYSLNFKGETEVKKEDTPRLEEQKPEKFESGTKNETKEKAKLSFKEIKGIVLDTMKDANKARLAATGILSGIVSGAVAGVGIGVLSKNFTKSQGKVVGLVTGSVKDVTVGLFNGIAKGIKNLPNKTIGSLVCDFAKLPSKFFNGYLKGFNSAKALTAIAATGVLAYSVVRHICKANKQNADIDHYSHRGHTTK